MDSMIPDPDPVPPPSLPDLRAHVARLEASHKAKGVNLSGRIIHVCHHLPVEIVKVVAEDSITPGSNLAPPMTPEFKAEDVQPTVESSDAKWKIHARTAHPALISGMKSLSETHDQFVVAWTGDVLLQPESAPTPQMASEAKFQSIAQRLDDNADKTPSKPNGRNLAAEQEKPLMVFGGEFTEEEQSELAAELKRFGEVETKRGTGGLAYVPVFLPPDVSRGHYEGFCKKSESRLSLANGSALAPLPLPSLARLDCDCSCA